MRSRKTSNDELAEVARRRLELLSAELAEIRPEPAGGRSARPSTPDPADLAAVESTESTDPPWPPSSLARTVLPAAPVDDTTGPAESGVPVTVSTGAGRHAHRSIGVGGRLSGWVQDRLPPTLQGGATLSVAHLAVVVTALVAGVLGTVWWLSTEDADSSAVPVAPPSVLVTMPSAAESPPAAPPASTPAGAPSVSPPATRSGAGASPAAPASTSVVVDVAGKVRRPGIATLPLGARVVDALKAAGGARRGVRLGSLNLARVLTDGEQIVVGLPVPPGVAASAASAPTGTAGSAAGTGTGTPLVNINTAGQAELEELPGIGPVTAQAILAFRTERGTFSSVDELLEVSGIGDATLADMAPYVTL
jgi:competence protein ComEA